MKKQMHPTGCKARRRSPEKFRPSLLRVLAVCQAALFLLTLVFLVVSTAELNRAALSQFRQEQSLIVQDQIAEVSADMRTTEQALRPLLNSTAQRSSLSSENPGERYFGKNAVYQEIGDICSMNPNIGFVFALQKDTFFVGRSSVTRHDTLELRTFLLQMAEEDFQSVPVFRWNLVWVDGNPYLLFAYCIPSQDLYVGSVAAAEMKLEPFIKAMGPDGALTVRDGFTREWCRGASQPQNAERMGYTYRYDLSDSLQISGYIPNKAGIQFRSNTRTITSLLGLACILGLLVQSVIVYRMYVKPMMELSQQLTDAENDHCTINAEASTKELYQLKTSIVHLLDEVVDRRMDAYESKLKEQDTQLFMLRSQLRPHFYLNAITTVNSMTYQDRPEEIRSFLNALSIHMRYMMRTDESRITLHEELKHIQAYIAMQEIRYPNRIIYHMDGSEGIQDIVIPHLIIYTIVENTFKYSMGTNDLLLIMIQCRQAPDGIHVVIEDNGSGYPEDILRIYNGPLPEELDPERKRHIGLRNVKQTLKLKYGRDDLFQIRNSEVHGAVTELIFPTEKEKTEPTKKECP